MPPLPGGATDVGPAGLDYPNRPYALQLGLGSSTNPPGGSFSILPADVNADSASAVTTGPAVLWVERPTVYTSSCYSEQTGYQPAYFVTGTQTLVATVLPPPTVVLDRETVVNGDTVNAYPEASWSTAILVWGGWTWAADTGASGGGVTFVSGCLSRSLTCKLVPHGDGHLYMPNLTVSGITQSALSPTIHVAQAHLTLTVDSAHIASGSQVKFTARRTDGQPVAVQSWVWTPGGGPPPGPLAVDCPDGDSLCVTVLENTSPADSTGVVQSGNMTAWAVLGTASESASVSVTVDHRLPPDTTGCGGAGIAERSSPTAKPTNNSTTACPPPGGGTPQLQLSVDRDTVDGPFPRIRRDTVNGIPVAAQEPDSANVHAILTVDGSPVAGAQVTIRAEFLPNTGGHSHILSPIRFETAARLTQGPASGQPVVGYFYTTDGQRLASVQRPTSASGTTDAKLVAGYLGGRARVIASSAVNGQLAADTAVVAFFVPGLVDLSAHVTGVYWIGGTAAHPQGRNWYVQDLLVPGLQAIADSMQVTNGGQSLYLQYNDASLPNGGTFTVDPGNAPGGIENPWRDHKSHDLGVDVDMGICYADAQGDGGNGLHRVRGTYDSRRMPPLICVAADTNRAVPKTRLDDIADIYGGVNGVHPADTAGTHYHIRFP